MAILRQALPEIRTLRDVSMEALTEHRALLPETLAKRAQHAVAECARVLEGASCLRRGDLPGLGRLMSESHESSRRFYEVTIPELDLLAESAPDVDGCVGARVAGGGFGGCVLALVANDALPELRARLQHDFEAAFGQAPRFLASQLGSGAEVVDSRARD